MTNSNLYKYFKKIFPDRVSETFVGTVVSKSGTSLILEDTEGRKIKVNNLSGVDYPLGSQIQTIDGIVLGRVSTQQRETVHIL